MKSRFLLMAALAAGFLLLGPGCSNTKLTAERNSLLSQNEELKQQLDAETQARQAADAKAQALSDQLTRTPPAPTPIAQNPVGIRTPGMNPVDMSGGVSPRGGSRVSVAPDAKPSQRDSDKTQQIGGDILFDSGKATLNASAKKSLDQLASTLKSKYSGSTIRVAGYADPTPLKSTAVWKSNDELALARAKAVQTYLTSKGVKNTTAVSLGVGDSKATKSLANERRVDVMVVSAN